MPIDLLGPPRVVVAGKMVEIGSLRAAALLGFLAAHPNRLFSRDEIVALLWDAIGPKEGRNRLNTTLTRLRQSLPQCLIHGARRGMGWDTGAAVTVDTVSFVQTVNEISGTVRQGERRRRLEEILSWRRGQFLEGFHLVEARGYEEWLSHQRPEWVTSCQVV